MKQAVFLLFLTLLSGFSHSKESAWYEGVWQTEGYGYVFSIQNNTVKIFERTSKSCLISGLSPGQFVAKESTPTAYFNVTIPGFINARMELYKQDDYNQVTFHRNDTNTRMLASRLYKLPEMCTKPPNPNQALNVFIQNFREHYPFLSRYPELLAVGNSKGSSLQEQSLFNELTNILMAFNDPHTAVVAPSIEQLFFGNELANPNVPTALELKQISQRVKKHYLVGPLTVLNEQIFIGDLADGLSYLAIDGFWGLSKEGTSAAEKLAMNAAMVSILEKLKDSNSLIIDVRAHSGGSDKLGVLLAGIFTANDYTAYRKEFVFKGGLQPEWKEGTPIKVRGKGSKAWLGKVAVLTSSATVSAGEAFVMALDQRTPRVIKVGDKTRGSFSDMLPRTLPNGWLFALPNERYLDSDGDSYDFVGISPDKFIEDDFNGSNKDRVLEAAICMLTKLNDHCS